MSQLQLKIINEATMNKFKEEWGECIRNLLADHGLTYREAERFVKGVVSYATVYQWAAYNRTATPQQAVAFLQYFPIRDRMRCMAAGGHAIPPEWLSDIPVIEAAEIQLRSTGILSNGEWERVKAVLEEVEAERKLSESE
jgi:hypothetical protein